MGLPNPKNQALSPGATDLGFGQGLVDELLDEDAKRKKRKEGQQADPARYGDTVLGPGTMQLFLGAKS